MGTAGVASQRFHARNANDGRRHIYDIYDICCTQIHLYMCTIIHHTGQT